MVLSGTKALSTKAPPFAFFDMFLDGTILATNHVEIRPSLPHGFKLARIPYPT
uniref:Uncharacterized protein n=1 Tax=Oryza brachyantha TaxID=4533 RepID=J3LFD7_ORYBR